MADKKKKTNSKSYFSVELFSMAFALLCALSFVCLISGDVLFGDLGLIVRGFFLGLTGYMAFPLLLGGVYLGVKGVVGFKAKKSVKALTVYAVLYAFFILNILQTIFTNNIDNYAAYISQCYESGASFSTAAPGGVLFALTAFPLRMVLGDIGVYVLCGIALLFLTLFLFRTPISNIFSKSKANRSERKTEKELKAARTVKPEPSATAADRTAVSGEVENGDEQPLPSRSAFGGGDFKLKSEKEKQDSEKDYTLKLLFGDNGSKNNNRNSYSADYDKDLAEKTEYIRRPFEGRGIRVESPMGDSPRSVSYDRDDGIDIDVSAPESDVYVIRNDSGRSAGSIDSFDRAGGRRGRDSDDDYNRDRFTRPGRVSYSDRDDFDSDSEDDLYSRSYSADRASMRDEYNGRMSDRAEQNADDEISSRGDFDNERSDRGSVDRSAMRSSVRGGRPEGGDADEEENTDYRYMRAADADSAKSAREDYDYNADEEGTTPNAAVLRKLNNLDGIGGTRRSRGIPDEDVAPGETEAHTSETQYNDNVERGDERYRRKPVDRTDSADDIGTRSSYGSGEPRNERDSFGTDSARAMRTSRTDYSDNGDDMADDGDYNETHTAKPSESSEPISPQRSGTQTKMPGMQEEKDNPIEHIPKSYRFNFPPLSLLKDYKPDLAVQARITREQNARQETILQILNNPNIDAQIYDVKVGPSLTRFEIQIPPKVQMRKVTEKYDDLNLWMEAKSRIRIIAPIPGTSRIGLEVPNSELSAVGVKEVMSSPEFKNAKKSSITFALGKDMVGKPLVTDIVKMPHLLVAGATGTGKSVFLNTLLVSLIYKYSPEELRIVLVDPKLVEFSVYRGIPELLFGEIFTEEKEASAMLDWMVGEMGRRYQLFRDCMVRDIDEYNAYVTETKSGKKLFRILIIIDEFADLMAVSDKKHMDVAIGRLAAKARSAGIHIILATQRPTTDIVDGSIKTNFPSRIVFKMSSATDAMVVMGEAGAEKLLGDGDMFYKVGKMTNVERAQGAFIVAEEVNNVCKYVRDNNKNYYDECALEEIRKITEENEAAAQADEADVSVSSSGEGGEGNGPRNVHVEDSFIKAAMRIAIQGNNISISLLQRRLGVGYPKAGKIIDALEAKGYISPVGDSNKRRILMSAEQFEQTFGEPL